MLGMLFIWKRNTLFLENVRMDVSVCVCVCVCRLFSLFYAIFQF